eukprot:CAMPEP_0172585904 /NCGR_PEP_ID=MMETSP1068-20121228/5286_1 /TAXON_ID=35684 /ORGANISM="Pseudopedinella elastica, Strain CCMP716" /LENGTH=268 /DNA_ID=CAMNT_0013380529 /DNA_START=32 /DNA_END=838 /DNA_ORIENTATION=+
MSLQGKMIVATLALISWRAAAFPVRRAIASTRHLGSSSMAEASNTAQGTPHKPQMLDKVLRFRGPVASGFGRGSKKLGFPTANLPASLFGEALENVQTGVYVGYASVEPPASDENGAPGPAFGVCQRAVVNVGFSPTFEEQNPEKIIEAYLMVDGPGGFGRDFYGCTMRLVLGAFLRPEQKFDAFPLLVAQINQDVADAKTATSAATGPPGLVALPSTEPWLQKSAQIPELAPGAVEWSAGELVEEGSGPPDRKWPEWQGGDVVTGGF